MKKRSTQKNKTRNFRKKNKTRIYTKQIMGGVRGSRGVPRGDDSYGRSKHGTKFHSRGPTTTTGHEKHAAMQGEWKPKWTEYLNTVISSEVISLMNLGYKEDDEEDGEKYGLLYDIYQQANHIINKSQQSDKDTARNKIIPLIDRFILRYTTGYTGEKLNPEYR
jgi:hypothetical protein